MSMDNKAVAHMDSKVTAPMDTDMDSSPVEMEASELSAEDLLVRLGEMLIALLLGEFLHRLVLIFEELPHVKERYNGRKEEMFWAVFSNCHNQAISAPLLALMGSGLVWYGSASFSTQILVNIASVAIVYFVLRTCGAMDNSLEDMKVLEEKNALLGPGLATNYWFGYLKWICAARDGDVKSSSGKIELNDLKEAFEDAKASTENGDEDDLDDINRDGLVLKKMARQGENFSLFPKLIVLLPSKCWRPSDLKTQDRFEGVFTHCDQSVQPDAPRCSCPTKLPCRCEHKYCSHDYLFKVEAQQRRAPIKATVHYIYEREEDERTHPNPQAKKIFVMFDFPMLLQSAMGPGRALEDKPSARLKNIETFEETLKTFLASNDYLRYKDLVSFHQYNTEDEDKENRRSLASRLRDRVILERDWLC